MERVYPMVGVGVNLHTCIFKQCLYASSDWSLLSTEKAGKGCNQACGNPRIHSAEPRRTDCPQDSDSGPMDLEPATGIGACSHERTSASYGFAPAPACSLAKKAMELIDLAERMSLYCRHSEFTPLLLFLARIFFCSKISGKEVAKREENRLIVRPIWPGFRGEEEGLDEALNDAKRAWEALCSNFLIQLLAFMHSLLPSFQDIGGRGIKDAATSDPSFVGGCGPSFQPDTHTFF